MLYVNPLAGVGSRFQVNGSGDSIREKAALEEIEHLFAFTLLQEMRKTVHDGGLFKSGAAQRMQDQLFDDAMAGHIAKSGQLGLARQIEAQLRQAERAVPSLSPPTV